eukprot:4334143-Prymnesium_polylepis.1
MVLAAHLNEINYAWRMDPMNHAPHFPYYVTAMVDVFPVYLPTGGGGQPVPMPMFGSPNITH